MTQPFRNTRIEFHILQSFPVSCLNRDDVGAPKTARIGGVTRARVSSQCWKRQVRLALRELGVPMGTRTKKVTALLAEACRAKGADEAAAEACGKAMADCLTDDTLLFISDSEAQAFAAHAAEQEFDAGKIKDKDLFKLAKKVMNPALDALDIALFGRMVAKAPELSVEAASAFSHAISTHKVNNEVEFFTALDDDPSEAGSSHMGSLEFNAATYYRYISLDLGQLAQSLEADQLKSAIDAFTKALFVAIPDARQTTMSGACPWDYARILVRRGQRLQVPFEAPIKAQGDGYLAPSKAALNDYLDQKETMVGSLFGKQGDYRWGDDETFSLDDLSTALQAHVDNLPDQAA
ncbi:MAG: type I-E CRISPR-associated protein Cas7/Cse4/CasC [Pseudomonadota bacterium]